MIKLGTILIISFLIIAIFVGMMGFIANNSTNKIIESFNEVTEDSVPVVFSLLHLEHGFQLMRGEILDYAIKGEQEDREEFEEALEHFKEHRETIFIYEGHEIEKEPEGKWGILINLLEETEEKLLMLFNELSDMKDSGQLEGKDLSEISQIKELDEAEHSLEGILNERVMHEEHELEEQQDAVLISHRTAERNSLVFGSLGAVLAIILGLFISRTISKPISKITSDVDEITKGKLDIQLEKSNIFEIQGLTDSLNRILASMKLAILRTGVSKSELGLGEAIKAKEEAEEKLKLQAQITKNMAEGAYIVGLKDVKIKYVNPKFAKMFGYNPEEMIGKDASIVNYGTKKAQEETAKEIMQIIHTTGEWQGEVQNVKKDGTLFWSHANVSTFTHPMYGEVLVAIHRDITRQKEAESKYKILYESSRDAIMTLEPPTWGFTAGNPATVKMFGAKDEKEFVSLGPGELSPKKQPNGQLSSVKAQKMIIKAMKEGSNFFEWTHKKINGGDFPATVLLTRVETKGKKFLQATVRNITEESRIKGKLRGEKEFSQTVIDTIPYGVDIVDENLNILHMNKTFTKLFGKGAIGKKCYEIYRDDKKQCLNCPLRKPIKVGETKSIITTGVAGGKTFKITHTGFALPNGKKAILELFQEVSAKGQTIVKEIKKKDKGYEKALKKLFSKYKDMPTREELEEVFLREKK